MAASRGIIGVRAAANVSGVLTFLTYATNAATASIYLRNADGTRSATPATVYTTENGGTTASQPIQADANSYFPGWLPQGRYVARISATGLSSWDEPFNVGVNVEDTNIDLTVGRLGCNATAHATYPLYAERAGSDQALIRSTGAFRAGLIIDNAAGGQQSAVLFQDAGVTQWYTMKDGGGYYAIFDAIGDKFVKITKTVFDGGGGGESTFFRIDPTAFQNGSLGARGTDAITTDLACGSGAAFFSAYRSIPGNFDDKGTFVVVWPQVRIDPYKTGSSDIYSEAACFQASVVGNRRGALVGGGEYAVNILAPAGSPAANGPGPARSSVRWSLLNDANPYSAYNDTAIFGAVSPYLQTGSRGNWIQNQNATVLGGTGEFMADNGGGWKRAWVLNDGAHANVPGTDIYCIDGQGYYGSSSDGTATANQTLSLPTRMTLGGANPTTIPDGIQLGSNACATPVNLFRSGASQAKLVGALWPATGIQNYQGTTPSTGAISPAWPTAVNPGTVATPTVGTIYAIAIEVPRNQIFNGIAYYAGAIAPAAEKVTVTLWDKDGTVLRTSTVAGTSISTVQTAANRWVPVPFTATITALGPGRYYIGVTFDTATASTFRETQNYGFQGLSANQTGYTFGNALPALTVPTGPATVVPLMYLY